MSRLLRRRRVLSAVAALLAITAIGVAAPVGSLSSSDGGRDPFPVHAMVFTTFDGEQAPWLQHEQFDLTFTSPGAFAVVHCQSRTHICVTMTGETKSNSGPSTMAILHDPQFAFSQRSLFIVGGIAGTRSSVGTLGSVGIANWIVDLDLGSHLLPQDAPPDGWLPFDNYPQAAQHLNEALAARAYAVARRVPLADDASAQAERAFYGEPQASAKPAVQRCDTGGSDDFWVGSFWADKADRITRERILTVDPTYHGYRCSSEFEDPAIASALNRFGYLDRLVDVRAASDLEDQRPGTTPRDLYDLLHSSQGFAGYDIATENGYRVASAIAHNMR